MDKKKITVISAIILVSFALLLSDTAWAKDESSTQGELAVALVSEIFTVAQPSPQYSARLLTQMGISPKGGWDLAAPITPELLTEIYQLLARIFPDSISPVTKTMLVAALRAGISFTDITTAIIISGVRWSPEDIAAMKTAAQASTDHHSALEGELSRARRVVETSGISAQQRLFPFTMADFRDEMLKSEKIRDFIGEDVINDIGDEFFAQILGDIISEGVRANQPPSLLRPPTLPPTEIASPALP